MKYGLALAAISVLNGCALLSKVEPLVPRYFTPENELASQPAPAASQPVPRRLRLGNVRGGSQLRERMMYRSSAHELGYYEDRRWTERPEAYLRRSLVRALFEERGVFRVVSGPALTLDAELIAFEIVHDPSQPKVRVQVVIALDDDQIGRLNRTITVEQPVRSADAAHEADAAVEALGRALQLCVTRVVERVMDKLAELEASQASSAQLDPRAR